MPQSAMSANLAQPSPEGTGRRPAGRYRPGRVAATALGLALLTAAAGCGGSGGGDQKSGGDSTAAAAAPTGIIVPKKIDTLTKQAEDPKFGTPDDGIPASVRKNLHSVQYADPSDSSKYVLIQGGLGLPVPAGSGDVVRRLFSEWAVSADQSKTVSVAPGSVGGSAGCAPSAASPDYLECGWVGGKVAITMSFSGFSKAAAKALVPKILDAMVQS